MMMSFLCPRKLSPQALLPHIQMEKRGSQRPCDLQPSHRKWQSWAWAPGAAWLWAFVLCGLSLQDMFTAWPRICPLGGTFSFSPQWHPGVIPQPELALHDTPSLLSILSLCIIRVR